MLALIAVDLDVELFCIIFYYAKAKVHLVLYLMFLLMWKVKYDVNVSGFSSGLKCLPLAPCVEA